MRRVWMFAPQAPVSPSTIPGLSVYLLTEANLRAALLSAGETPGKRRREKARGGALQSRASPVVCFVISGHF
jgi:hypothetical protein